MWENVGRIKGDKGDGLVLESWKDLVLENGWIPYDSARKPMYTKDNVGRVYFKGLIKDGAIGSNIGQVPSLYRPTSNRAFPVIGSDVVGIIRVNTGGTLYIYSTPNPGNLVYLDSISYVI